MPYQDFITEQLQRLEDKKEIVLRIKVHPKASKTEAYGMLGDDILKVHVKATPERGKANNALAKYLSTLFNVPSTQITIISGHTDPVKLIKLTL